MSLKRWAARGGLMLASLGLMVGAAEATLRFFNPLRLDWRMVEHHPVRIETLSPNYDGWFGPIRVKTNRFGHRVPTTWPKRYERAKPAGVKRVLVFGDSFTFGDEWPAEDSFVERLQQELDPTFSRVQVINFGVPGYNAYQEWNYISEEALRFEPDAVVVGFTDSNDLVPILMGAKSRHWQAVKTWLRRHLWCYSVVWDVWYHGRRSALAKALFGASPPAAAQTSASKPIAMPSAEEWVPRVRETTTQYYHERQALIEADDPGWQQAWASYQRIQALLEAAKVPLLIMVITPNWDSQCLAWDCQGATLTYREAVEPGLAFYGLLRRYLGSLTPHYVSLEQAFGPYTLERLHDPSGHYGPRKNAIVAAQLAQRLRQMRVAPERASEGAASQRMEKMRGAS